LSEKRDYFTRIRKTSQISVRKGDYFNNKKNKLNLSEKRDYFNNKKNKSNFSEKRDYFTRIRKTSQISVRTGIISLE
jgi:hypothetical protein